MLGSVLAQAGLYAFTVAPLAPYFIAFRRVSSNLERMYVADEVSVLDPLEPCRSSNSSVLCIQQSTGNSASPQIDLSFPLLATQAAGSSHRRTGYARLAGEPGRSTRTPPPCRDQVDHAIRDNDVEAARPRTAAAPPHPRRTSTLSSPSAAAPSRAFAVISGVISIPVTRPRADHQAGNERVRSRAGAEIEHTALRAFIRPSVHGFATPANDSTTSREHSRHLRRDNPDPRPRRVPSGR